MKAIKITFLISLIYLIIGNIVGYGIYKAVIDYDGLLYYLFLPYTFTWGLSAMVGTDWLTLTFILIAFLVLFAIFFPIGLYLSKRN